MAFRRRKEFRSIPYGMFDIANYGLAAKNARVLERVYHKGNDQSWDGKEVLNSLIEQFGTPTLPEKERKALGRVFAIILWGELAAWRISAELADEIEPLEPKMAATSQAFDEARHFYVMHDYLEALGGLPEHMPWGARRLLEETMNANNLARKLLGMQLMVEPVALALFHVVKELDVEPVLTHLLPYYERDESRHVALGIQYLPALLSQMSRAEQLSLWTFQVRLLTYEIASNYNLMRDLQVLGVEPRSLVRIGKGKQLRALEMVNEALGVENDWTAVVMDRYADSMVELTLPAEEGLSVPQRVKNALHVIRHGTEPVDVQLIPDIEDAATPLVRSLKESAFAGAERLRSVIG